MSDTKKVTVNLSTPLFLVFLVLKLTNVIDWSWWWVTAPLWIPGVFWVAVLAGMAALVFFAILLDPRKRR